MKIIDPHLHLFNLKQGEYHWLKANNAPFWPDKALINKNFSEMNLQLSAPLELTGFVHIEAGFDNVQPWQELQWLEQSCNIPFKSIAFIDITLPEHAFVTQLKQLMQCKSLAGCRYILDENAAALLTSHTVTSNLNLLANAQLIFEVQMPLDDKKSICALSQILSGAPALNIVINHAGWPTDCNFTDWQKGLEQLSQFSQCALKCSGWEMTNRQYNREWQQKVLMCCLNTLGYKRVMLASNFPLCLFSQSSYQTYWQTLLALPVINQLNAYEKNALCYDNALNWYGISE